MLLPSRRERPQIVLSPEINSPTGGDQMGFVYADIELVSGDDLALNRRGLLPEDQIKRVKVKALADSGSYMLVISEHIREQLDLPVIEERIAKLADESERRAKVAGPVEVRLGNRRTIADALVFPENVEVLLGSIPMEDMDVVSDPKHQRLIENPENPYVPLTYVK
jgi:clan AA aspartic protease